MTASSLPDGPVKVLGRLPDSSNNALLCSLGSENPVRAVYKPVAGEQPLWDFPAGTLTRREKATSVLDELLGWNLVPATQWIETGPAGPGIMQAWVDGRIDLGLFEPPDLPSGWVGVVDAETQDGPVVVAHRDDEATHRLAAFDVVINNADRKGGHLLRNDDGLFAIDHGVTFHTEPKLRTVLWGFRDDPVPDDVLSALEAQIPAFDDALGPWLEPDEIGSARDRATALLRSGVYPGPSGQWPALPWPLI